ncbi:MAG: DNA polymerase III subunit delta [Planctomycetaceae bacterium]|nr:DNA polymerase III subunit delta [Planctomycetaceae bacterium]
MHATEFARKTDAPKPTGIVILHGGELHLRNSMVNTLCQRLFGSAASESIGLTKFPGKSTDFKTVRDELLMVSMFSSEKIVVVEQADDFVTQFRPQLENYAESPSKRSLLVLDLKTWRKNTKLAKRLDSSGLVIECSELTGAALIKWLVDEGKAVHGKTLARDAAQLMAELVGNSMGHLTQELDKLAAYVGDRERISQEDVRTLVGGWKTETTWTMINAVRDGQPGLAINCLNKLLYAGEAPQKILGGMNFVFRKIAMAVETSRQGRQLKDALKEAGVFYKEIPMVEQYLRRIGRPRAERILEFLAETDYGLKGGSRLPENLQMEQLILRLSGAVR